MASDNYQYKHGDIVNIEGIGEARIIALDTDYENDTYLRSDIGVYPYYCEYEENGEVVRGWFKSIWVQPPTPAAPESADTQATAFKVGDVVYRAADDDPVKWEILKIGKALAGNYTYLLKRIVEGYPYQGERHWTQETHLSLVPAYTIARLQAELDNRQRALDAISNELNQAREAENRYRVALQAIHAIAIKNRSGFNVAPMNNIFNAAHMALADTNEVD